ncbi:caspase-8-like [Kryptolebias marmoratus]|uniref:Caspase-8-like n=1 Tax=Kryptolebias marmoratus TaxID=37003 RepID=A0A3Q3A4Q4_KRYMA|nr:caspase-8-like [Kryptolebias marmoratus]
MSARDTLRRNKTRILQGLCADYSLILNKAQETNLITSREYNNLKSISNKDVEGHVVELVDKIMNKGENTSKAFLDLLQTDEEIKTTFPELRHACLLPTPVQASSPYCGDMVQESKRQKKDEAYALGSQPVGLCVIINNENFTFSSLRRGTNKDAQSLAEVFSWLGFRVLMCKDQTRDQMAQTLASFASLGDSVWPPEPGVEEWSGGGFAAPQQALEHGDAFVCCILSHGAKGEVLGTDSEPLAIKDVTRAFKATEQSALTGKPKVFLIQACQGGQIQQGVLMKDGETYRDPWSVPQEADYLVAVATVEDHAAFRHPVDGSWFVQSVCQQLKERCPRGEDLTSILLHVNNDVGQKEGSSQPGKVKQIPEVRYTLTKRLLLSPHRT